MTTKINEEHEFLENKPHQGILFQGDPKFSEIFEQVNRTKKPSVALNSATDPDEIREMMGQMIGKTVDNSTTVFTPFNTNYGRNITLGKNVFINHACSFLDLGGITIEDDVLIGPNVQLITENHPLNPEERKSLVLEAILIRENAWIGAGAIILPGVTIGKNSVVAAGAVVTKDVPENTVVAGVPAKIVKQL
ncbi:sugar O-acetyltransferase [Aquirufa ecclesiirivi]